MSYLRFDQDSPFQQLVGVGGVGAGIFFELEGDQTLGRNESRLGRLLDVRDYCKLHIVVHYVAKLLGTRGRDGSFRVVPIAKVGDDATADRLIREMSDVGIDTSRTQKVAGAPTLFSVCFQYPDGSGGNITTSNSAALLSQADIDKAQDLFRAKGKVIALAVPEVPLAERKHFLELASRSGAFRIASFARAEVRLARTTGILELLDLVALNQNEGEELVGISCSESSESFIQSCQEFLRTSYPKLKLIVSAGKLGAHGITAQSHSFCPAPKVAVASTAGAGDALLGGVIAGLATGFPFLGRDCDHQPGVIDSALELGVLLGSFKCLSPHTIHPDASLDRLMEFAAAHGLALSPIMRGPVTSDCAVQSTEQGSQHK